MNNDKFYKDIFSLFVEKSSDIIIVVDLEGNIIFANASAHSLISPESLERIAKDAAAGGFASKKLSCFNFTSLAGKEGILQGQLTRIQWQGKEAYLFVLKDVTSEKEAQEKLRLSELKIRSLVQSATDAIIVADSRGKIILWNQAATSIFGWRPEEVLGKSLTLLMPPRYRKKHLESLERVNKTGKSKIIGKIVELTGLRKNGEEFPLEISLSTWRVNNEPFYSGIIRDISQRKEFEEELKRSNEELKTIQTKLLQAEKLAAIGELAAGVAHEINNPLFYITTNLSLLKEFSLSLLEFITELEAFVRSEHISNEQFLEDFKNRLRALSKKIKLKNLEKELPQVISECIEGTKRIKDIVYSLLTFSRPDSQEYELLDINKEIELALTFIWPQIKDKVDIGKKFSPLPPVKGHPGQIKQVFVNIFINAAQAISDKGYIFIKTYSDDKFVYIESSDTGCGIPADKIDKIFQPFFTTKDKDKGTGLGLSICYSIIKAHQGNIEVESEEGIGTTFRISLPIAREE